jgi:hypothetical protein
MTIDFLPARDYATDMQAVADAMRRNTHLIVARGPYAEVLTRHARPRAEAEEYAATWAPLLGPGWTVKAVPVRRAGR